jgi:mono/diheme cytochrome c family protein
MSGAGGLGLTLAASLVAARLLAAERVEAGPADATGKRLYVERCAPCHGDDGGGDGPAAPALEPRPQNFRDAAFWKERGADQLRQVVRHGKPGTMMQPFEGVLTDDEIEAVVAYVERFRPAAGAGARPGDGQVSVTGIGEDATRSSDRPGGGGAALRSLHP